MRFLSTCLVTLLLTLLLPQCVLPKCPIGVSHPTHTPLPQAQSTTLAVSSGSAEIVSFSKKTHLLLATSQPSTEILVFSLTPNPHPSLLPLPLPHKKTGIALPFSPTSIASHPTLPLAYAVGNSQGHGVLATLDLAALKRGAPPLLTTQPIGAHLDSVAVSKNGRWIVLADEAEKSRAPGAILLAKLPLSHSKKPLAFQQVQGLDTQLHKPLARIEPEYVAIDPHNRYAAASCQENDAVVLFYLNHSPHVTHTIHLPKGSQPDGIALFSSTTHGDILAIAQEGSDSIAFYAIEKNLHARLLSQLDISGMANQYERCDPESFALFEQSGTLYAAVTVERADKVLLFNLNDPSTPVPILSIRVGSSPEGLIALKQGKKTLLITGNEGHSISKGSISIFSYP